MTNNTNQLPFEDVIGASVNDMRNSLGQVRYKLESIAGGIQGEEATAGLKIVDYEVTRMQNVVNQLHGLYLMESDKLIVQMQETYVLELIDDILAGMESLLQINGVEIEVIGEDLCWYLDPYLLTGVLNIAVLNAVRYTQDKICITVEEGEDGLSLTVDDNGAGYPDIVLERFNSIKSGESIDTFSSQNIGWLYCEKVAAQHKNKGVCGQTVLDNQSVIGGGRLRINLP
ncbi:sensor histidine kinase [Rhodanobacter aciditrophus]|uniref:histidine kinase n=1 Tax=Rhodanobacter aciditrophus TaxID=1623218 RepID=A0ABW4B0M3_9GAMM